MNIVKSDINKWRVSIALGILFLLIFLGMVVPQKLHAAITSPYIVDEKPSVHFGDSATIIDEGKTYFGLENYRHDYVGGYLHISFTYTHGILNWASYPPGIYITDKDPRSTTTLSIKLIKDTYTLSPLAPSDWYLYDIQFDANGFRLTVKQSGETEIENRHIDISNLMDIFWISLANTYPLSENNQPNEYSMSFTPMPLKSLEPPQPTKIPVIIVPGIMGSYLYKEDGTEVWMNISEMILSIDDSYLNILKLSTDGISINKINANSIIKNTIKDDFFNKLIDELINFGYEENIDLFIFPYDWRLDIHQSAEVLNEKIKKLKLETNTSQVDIIAHSMGGLIIKDYLQNFETGSISKFIDIGTPHLGSPKAFKIINYGDNLNANFLFGLIGLNSETIKNISQNMPSIYELLPSRKYTELSKYVYDLDDVDNNKIKGGLNYDETNNLLSNLGRNNLLIDKAETFHSAIDNLDPRSYGVETYNIIGCGTETLGKIFILNKENSGGVEYNISYVNGDGTVPLVSAKALPSDHVYYYKNATHALMPSAAGVKELIASILYNDPIDPSSYNQITSAESNCPKISGQVVSFHSPINLHIYDSQNRHSGPLENGDIENNIPEVSYEVIDGNKFAFLPNGEDFKVVGVATENGSFNARIEKIQDEIVTETKYFNEIPILSTTKVEFTINDNTSNQIQLDKDGDGIFETQIDASSILNQAQSADLVKPTTNTSLKGNKTNNGSYISSVQVSLLATDDNSGILKTEYSFDIGSTWNNYIEPFTINARGGAKIIYRSTDKAGNIEAIKELDVNIIYPANSGKKN